MGIMPPSPLAYEGDVSVPWINRSFPPLPANNTFAVPTLWTDTSTGIAYLLTMKPGGVANWIVLGTSSIATFPITPFVVGPVGQAGYQTIQSGINAANAAGGGVVYIQPGTYTENLTLYDKVDLYATPAVSQNQPASTTIIGTHTPPASGHAGFNSICFISTTDVFLSAAAGTTHLVFLNCESAVQNGYFLNVVNWTGILEIYDFNPSTAGAPFSINDGGINNTAGATILIFSAGFGSGTNIMQVSGPIFCQGSSFGCPVNFLTGSNIGIDQNIFSSITLSNNSTGQFSACRIEGGSSPAITMSSSGAIKIFDSIVDSSNNPAIAGAGAGTLTLGDITFPSNASIAGTLTVAGAGGFFPSVYTAHGVLLGEGNACISVTTAGTSGQVLTSNGPSADPTFQDSDGGFRWGPDENANFNASTSMGYFCVAPLTAKLPAVPVQGDTISFIATTTSITIQAGGSAVIEIGNVLSSAGGTATNIAAGDSLTLTYRSSGTTWWAYAVQGSWVLG